MNEIFEFLVRGAGYIIILALVFFGSMAAAAGLAGDPRDEI